MSGPVECLTCTATAATREGLRHDAGCRTWLGEIAAKVKAEPPETRTRRTAQELLKWIGR